MKLLKFQETFLEKFLWSGFGAEAPTDNTHKKHGVAVLFILEEYVGTAFQTLLEGAFFKKPLKNPQKLPSNTLLYFGESF